MSKKFLLSAVFSAGVLSAGALAGDMQVLNEEELEDVSAQGLQVIENDNRQFKEINGQNNNLDSVQLNDNAQLEAQAGGIINVAKTALNAAVNLLADGPEPGPVDPPQNGGTKYFNYYFSQTNVQVAMNHVNTANNADAEEKLAIAGNLNKETQSIDNNGNIREQDNNNNSVQLNDSAQSGASALDMTNSAVSAGNTGMNVMAATTVSTSEIHQGNYQSARNFDNEARTYNGNPESEDIAVATNAEIAGEPGQYVHTVHATIGDQNNNNNSVQLNDDAQSSASALFMTNMAQSAVNSGLNLLFVDGNVDDSTVSQTNEQFASNHNNYATANALAVAINLNKQRQIIENCFCSDLSQTDQDNNMNSVQLNDNAQSYASGWMIVNAATSAVNSGTNLAVVNGVVSGSSVTQTNVQTSVNFSNQASGNTAIAGNAEIGSLFIPIGF